MLQRQSLSAQQVATLLKVSPARVRQLADPADPGLHFITSDKKLRAYPQWQFTDQGTIPHLRKILAVLNSAAHPVAIHRLMTLPSPDLASDEAEQKLSPRDWLISGHDPEPVIRLTTEL
jgi:hypothetical protein